MEQTAKDVKSVVATVIQTRNNGTTSDISPPPTHYIYSRGREGYDNPKWRDQVKRSVQAGTDFSAHQQSARGYIWSYGMRVTKPSLNPTALNRVDGYGIWYPNPKALTLADATSIGIANNLALTHLVKNIRREQTTFQGGVFLGELGEVVRMLRSPGRALRRGFDEYFTSLDQKVRPIRSKRSRSRALTDTWLEYSFGWTPLLNDIRDATDLINKVRSEVETKPVSGFGEHSTKVHGIVGQSYSSSPYFRIHGYTARTAKVIYKSSVGAERVSQNLVRQVGLDLSNFVPTLWELIPYSFVVDYFSNIGDIISAASLARSSVRWIMKTTVLETVIQSTAPMDFSYPSSTYTLEYASARPVRALGKQVNRIRYHGTLVPDISFSLPGSGRRWLNLAALANRHRTLAKALNR